MAPASLRLPRRFLLLLALLLAATVPALAGRPERLRPAPNRPVAEYRPDTVLVAFRSGASPAERLDVVRRYGLTAQHGGASPHFVRLTLPAALRAGGVTAPSLASRLLKEPAVRIAEPNWIVHAYALPNDPRFGEQWALNNTGQTGGTPDADIDAPRAWERTIGTHDVTVAILDTGVDHNHLDLTDNILRDADENVIGADFVNDDADPMDDNGHGTHVAGIVGARGDNGLGITGVCKSVSLMPLKMLGSSGSGVLEDAVEAIDFAREHGARIINASWGGWFLDGAVPGLLYEALVRARDAGVLVVCAAGNNGVDLDYLNYGFYPGRVFPAAFGSVNRNLAGLTALDNIVVVAASDEDDRLAESSNYSETMADLAAPGVGILSTLPGGGFGLASGTSMAAPHVSGAAALLLSAAPELTAFQLKQRLLAGVRRPDALKYRTAAGRLSAGRCLEADTTPPAAARSLRVTYRSATTLTVAWTAPGDNGNNGTAGLHDLRYSIAPITEENFAAATRAPGLPHPLPAGSEESYQLVGPHLRSGWLNTGLSLAPGTGYYLALRTLDNAGNASPLVTAGPFLTRSLKAAFADDVEGEPRLAMGGAWGITSEDSFSGQRSYSPWATGSDYYGLRLPAPLPLPRQADGLMHYVISFRAKLVGSAGLGIDAHNGPNYQATNLWGLRSGSYALAQDDGGPWKEYTLSVEADSGEGGVSFIFGFGLQEDSKVFVDDIRIYNNPLRFSLWDNAEGSPRFRQQAPWAVREQPGRTGSPTHAYGVSQVGTDYPPDLDALLTQAVPASLSLGAPSFSYPLVSRLERLFDFLYLELSRDGGATWEAPARAYNTFSDYQQFTEIPFAQSWIGGTTRARFRLTTDAANGGNTGIYDGPWLDDLRISGEPLLSYVPAAPSNLRATPVSPTQIRLDWGDVPDNETAYDLERTEGETVIARILPPNTKTYLWSGLTPGTTSSFRLRSRNGAGSSEWVGPAAATTYIQAPTNVRASALSSTEALVTWTDGVPDETGFRIERSLDGGASYGLAGEVPAGATSYTHVEDVGNTAVRFRVRALRDAVSSLWVAAPAVRMMRAPSDLTATPASASSAQLAWSDNATSESEFQVERKVEGGEFAVVKRLRAGSVAFLDAGRATGVTYVYRVRAKNATGYSSYSAEATVTLP